METDHCCHNAAVDVAWRCLSLTEFNFIKVILCLGVYCEYLLWPHSDRWRNTLYAGVSYRYIRFMQQRFAKHRYQLRSLRMYVVALLQYYMYLDGRNERRYEIRQLDSWSRFESGTFWIQNNIFKHFHLLSPLRVVIQCSFRLSVALESFQCSFWLSVALESFQCSFWLSVAFESFHCGFRLSVALETIHCGFRFSVVWSPVIVAFGCQLLWSPFSVAFDCQLRWSLFSLAFGCQLLWSLYSIAFDCQLRWSPLSVVFVCQLLWRPFIVAFGFQLFGVLSLWLLVVSCFGVLSV